MRNKTFLEAILASFREFIKSGTSRSTKKLKPLHGKIAFDLAEKLGEGYKVFSQGYGEGKEVCIAGRYFGKSLTPLTNTGNSQML